jgi:sigma-B regulation protein RsbU (phosphoserine phosphatase)
VKDAGRRAGASRASLSATEGVEASLDDELRLLVEEIYGPEIGDLPGLEVGRAYWGARSAFPYGGDVVDVFQYGNGCTAFAVVDISGHGIRAAKNAGLTKHALRAYVSQGFGPVESIRALNHLYIENCAFECEPEFFATAFFAIIDAERTSMQYVAAGHEAACVVNAEGHRFLDATGPIVGLLDDDLAFREETIAVKTGDIFAAVTDGFTEARDQQNEFLGRDALATTIEHNRERSADQQAQALTMRAFGHANSRLQDDVAALVVRVGDRPV